MNAAGWSRGLEVTGGAGVMSHAGLVKELDRLAGRHGYQVTYSVGWALSAREQTAIGKVPRPPGRPPSTRKADEFCSLDRSTPGYTLEPQAGDLP